MNITPKTPFKTKRVDNLVSICLPTYNRANKLAERITGLLKQAHRKTEIIIVNDGSTDGTKEVLKAFEDNPKIKIIHLDKNSGSVCIPRNIAISHSEGEFIAPCDDDVIDEKDKLETLVEGLQKDSEAVLCYGNRYDFIGGTHHLRIHPNYNPLNGWGVDNSQFIYRADVYEQIPFQYFCRACDWNLCKKLWKLGKFIHINKIVSCYIFHGQNRSSIKLSDEEQQIQNDGLLKKVCDFSKFFLTEAK